MMGAAVPTVGHHSQHIEVRMHPQRDPDIRIAGLQLWILGRQFPNAQDYWDGNWLNVMVACSASAAEVRASGAILHLSELNRWVEAMRRLHEAAQGEAELDCMEPNLHVKMSLSQLGQLQMIVHLTPDDLTQKHEFMFELDQSYLPALIAGCERVLKEYPLRQ